MELKRLDRRVLRLWYLQAAVWVLVPVAVLLAALTLADATGATDSVFTAVALGVGVPAGLLAALILVFPYWRWRCYAWGYDDKIVVVQQGVIFKERVVLPVCQIQDLHRFQGPLMMAFRLSGVTVSTAGSNFNLSTLPTAEADAMIEVLERHLEARIEALRDEEI